MTNGKARAPLFTVRRLVISLILAAAVGGTILAFSLAEPEPETRLTNPAVRTVYPDPGDQLARQTTVFVELQPGYAARALIIQDKAIGGDDLEVIQGLNRYSYTPGPGKLVEQFAPGRTCPTVEFVDTSTPNAPLQQFSWCFSLG